MKRRSFIAAGLSAAAAASFAQNAGAADLPSPGKFKLKYAPKLTMFTAHAGPDPIDNLKFMADQGFSAFFELGLASRPNAEQIMKEAERLGMTAGPISAGAKANWVLDDDAVRTENLETVKKALENAKRLNIEGMLVVPGRLVDGMTMEQMTANVVKNLKFISDKIDFGKKIIVLEPLNPRNHPGMFLTRIKQAVEICKAVGNPSIKIVNDLYHQQITEGDLIPNIDLGWDYTGAFHLGDTPGRNEPLSGEINYRNIFKHLSEKGCQFTLCMEHGLSLSAGGKGKKKKKGGADAAQAREINLQGEKRLIAAYRWCDAFDQPIV